MKWYILLKDWGGQKAGAKLQISEADAKSLVETGYAKESTADPAEEIINGVVKELMPKFQAQIKTQMDAVVAGIGTSIEKAGKQKVQIEITDPRNADNMYGYKSTDLWLTEIKSVCAPGGLDSSKLSDNFKSYAEANYKTPTGLNTSLAEDGGLLTLPAFSQQIYTRVYTQNLLLSKIDQYTVNGNSMIFPRDSESSRATGSRRGGIRGYWTAEGGQLTSSRPKFDRMTLTLKKLTVLAYMTEEMMEDNAMSLEQYLARAAADEIDFLLHDGIINGTGVGGPLGILNSSSRVTLTAESGQGANTVVAKNISKMWARLHPASRANAIWLINQEVEPQLDQLALSIGTGGSTWPLYLPPGGLSDLPYGRLKGRPVMVNEWCPALGTEGDITLWDPTSYCAITKGGIKASMSIHLRFDYDELVWKFTFRFDGQPWWNKPLTPFKGTATLSPIVTLNSTRT